MFNYFDVIICQQLKKIQACWTLLQSREPNKNICARTDTAQRPYLTVARLIFVEVSFLKDENLFQKNWISYCLLVESTKIENATFPYRTALSAANFNTNRMGSSKQTYHKNEVLPLTTSLFLKILFQYIRTSYKELIWCTNTQMSMFILYVRAGVLFKGAFSPLSILILTDWQTGAWWESWNYFQVFDW